MRLLIADDENIIRQGLLAIDWSSIGITDVKSVSSGAAALKCIAQECPDVILADICMPGFSGLELAKYVDEQKRDCKVILLTGYEKFSYAKDAIRYNVFEYLLKPSSTEEILLCAKRAITQLEAKEAEQKRGDAEKQLRNAAECHNNSLIHGVMGFMEQNYMEDITLQQCADYVHVSVAYCSRLIKKETSYSFTFLLNTIRMLKAVELISQTNEKVFEICERVGIPDQRYFSRQFKKMFGMTPLEYRKKSGNIKPINIADYIQITDERK